MNRPLKSAEERVQQTVDEIFESIEDAIEFGKKKWERTVSINIKNFPAYDTYDVRRLAKLPGISILVEDGTQKGDYYHFRVMATWTKKSLTEKTTNQIKK